MINDKKNVKRHLLYLSILFGLTCSTTTWSGATLDGSMGTPDPGNLNGNFSIPEAYGQLHGTNLFHSFSDFNINAGESATFTATSSITNVISRVSVIDTTNTTTINGALISNIAGANFYFMNPNGIVFKEGAAISVDGSFYATTSDFIRLGQDGIIFADAASSSSLTSSAPSSFGFLTNNPGSITLDGTQLATNMSIVLGNGDKLSFIGGDINIEQSSEGIPSYLGSGLLTGYTGSFIGLQANAFEMVSVASAGEAVPVTGGYDLSSFSALGNVTLSGNSIIDTTDVYIRGGNITIEDSVIAPGYLYVAVDGTGWPAPDGGNIDIGATGQISISGAAPIQISSVANADPYVVIPGGTPYFSGISVFAGNPDESAPATDVPEVNISGGDVSLSGAAAIISTRLGPGVAGNININGQLVEIINGAFVGNVNTYFGAGGDINITADQLVLDGGAGQSTQTGLNASSIFNPYTPSISYTYADSGNITLNITGADGLTIKNGAYISTESRAFGRGGNITINSTDINLSRDGATSGAIASQSIFAGDAGNITITATGDINIDSGFEISASTAGTGTGGDISITANGAINISGENSGIFSAAPEPTDAVKDYLAQFVSTMGLPVSTFDELIATLYGMGATWLTPDSNMYVVLETLQMMGAINVNDPSGALGDLLAGNAGSITLDASTLNMSNSSGITSSTSADGNGGAINITVDSLAMTTNAEIRSRSGLINSVTELLEVGSGTGGDINITATESVSMQSGASISSSSQSSTGDAGNITINAGNTLDMADSSITTEASQADGGNITLRAIERIYLDNSDITTSVESGVGSGGNIDIDPEFVILKSSNILANAYGGPGGNITIVADNFLQSPDSVIDASSALSQDGEVNISSPDEDVSDDLAVLPDNYLDVTSLISERCGSGSGSSSLVNAGSGGMNVDPDSYLPSYAVTSPGNDDVISASNTENNDEQHWSTSYQPQSALELAQLTCTTR